MKIHRLALFSLAFAVLPVLATETRILADFETPAELKAWEFRKPPALSDQHVTHGKSSVVIAANEYMATFRKQDWSGFDSLDIDIFTETDEPVAVSVLIADAAWQGKGSTYWNRYNGGFNLSPGANTLSIPVGGLYRGEAGSRNNDLKFNIDPKTIVRFDIGFQTKSKKGTLYLDHMRLTKESLPEGVLAFDFGPESQVVSPGFTPLTWSSVHGKDGRKHGLQFAAGGPNSARDDTFPTRLYQDYVMMEGNEFVADMPDGLYHVWLMYDDCGYWGGEEARFKRRSVSSGGKVLWSEERDPADYLYRFENVEPSPGDSIWDLYMKDLFSAKRFDVEAKDGTLRIRFSSEGALGSKVAALIVYPDAKKAEGEKFVAEVEARNRAEFESKAVSIGSQSKLDQANELIWSFKSLESDEPLVALTVGAGHALGARGQRVSLTFAVPPCKNAGQFTLVAGELKGPNGTIPAANVECRVVRNALHRTYNNIAYSIGPESLRKLDGAPLSLKGGSERQFWITVKIPDDAPGGVYSGALKLQIGAESKELPYNVGVVPVKLDEPDFAMGVFGTHVPSEVPDNTKALRELFATLKEYGMNSLSGGPSVRFNGLDAAGRPKLDFAACDEYMRLAREAGFNKPVNSYGGPGMVQNLHDSYTIGETGRAWEKKTGKPFGELLELVWREVEAHAKAQNWLPIEYEMTDEPRVVEACREQLELMRLYRKHVPFVDIGGSYSVNWTDKSPFETEVQNIFKTLNWSSLNLHTQADFDKAKEFGKRLYIYNQGATRYSFGAYQWAEFHKGVRGRMEWHLLALHGWQFFDLDGREPDTAMLNWGKSGIIPTIKLARCREGADDFRFAVTLWNLAEKKKESPAAKEAREWLDDISHQIAPGQNRAPQNFMNGNDFRKGCADRIHKLID